MNREEILISPIVMIRPMVISKHSNKGGSRHNHAIDWVWPSYNHAHIFKDGNTII